jgi:hypothetical protein
MMSGGEHTTSNRQAPQSFTYSGEDLAVLEWLDCGVFVFNIGTKLSKVPGKNWSISEAEP